MSLLHKWMRLVAVIWLVLALMPGGQALASQRSTAFSYGATYSGYHDVTARADRSNVGFTSDTVFNGGPLFNEQYGRGNQLPHDAIGTVESNYPGHFEDSTFSYDADRFLTAAAGWGHPATLVDWGSLAVDAAGRPTTMTGNFGFTPDPPNYVPIPGAAFTYAPGANQLATATDASGTRNFTYDSRGNVSTVVAAEGTYTFAYDAIGRNTHVTYPDGHTRTQTFDSEGRLLLRCYGGYGGGLPDRCYGAAYDAVGNPTSLTDPEGTETLSYDGLDRLTSVVRAGVTESYTYNALGALDGNAPDATGVQLDDQRPRLDGNGKASAGVPATLDAQPITLDALGRVTSLLGDTLTFDARSRVFQATRADGSVETYGYDPWMRRIARTQSDPATYGANEYDVYVGPNIGATVDSSGNPTRTWLFEGTDAPLRVNTLGQLAYYELDTTGNVRRLRGAGGANLGGYRYSAFGVTYPEDAGTPGPTVDQPLRWKGRPFLSTVGGGVYDMRARWWSPRLGAFLAADAFQYASQSTTLWGWWNQNPVRFGDPSGHDGTTDNPVQDLLNSGLLPPSLSLIGQGFQQQNAGYNQLTNDATVNQGLNNIACGGQKIAGGSGVLGGDAQVLLGVAGIIPGALNLGVGAVEGATGLISESADPVIEAVELEGIQANNVVGNAAADELAAQLQAAGLDVEREVAFQTPAGLRFADIQVSSGGEIQGLIEVKTGDSPYTSAQRLKDFFIQSMYGIPTNVVRYPSYP